MRKKVLLLVGGFSAEREVSLSAGQDIAKALESKGYEVITHDLTDAWDLVEVLKTERPDAVFNGLYGNWGEDGAVQGLLDMLQIPYTHSGLRASALGMDKELTKAEARACGIKVAESERMTAAEFMEKGTRLAMPYVLKPVSDGSSVGVYVIFEEADLQAVCYDDPQREIMAEKYIPGRELTAMCLNGKAYAVTELKPKEGFYDYRAKYTNGLTEHLLPAELPENVRKTCLEYAEKLYRRLGCRTLARVDLRYNETDGAVLLEINTNPGMTALSLVPEQACYAGIGYADLCEILVENATCRKR